MTLYSMSKDNASCGGSCFTSVLSGLRGTDLSTCSMATWGSRCLVFYTVLVCVRTGAKTMQVVVGVVLQASVPACVVLTLLWLHGAVDAFYIIPLWSVYIQYNIYACFDRLSLVINNIRGIYKPRLSAGRRVSAQFLILMVLLFGIVYDFMCKQIDTLFSPGNLDQLIAYIHLPLVFNCAAQETSRLLSFFYNMGKLFDVQLNITNLWLLLIGMCYINLHACALIYAPDLLYVSAMSSAAMFGFDNYFTIVDINQSLFEYQRLQDGNINSESDSSANWTVAGTETPYWRCPYDRTDVIKNEHDVTMEVGVNWYNMIQNNHRRYQRYVGEDINISCSFETFVQQNEIGVYHTQFWKHNGRRLVSDKRHSEGISLRYVNKSYRVHMYLAIRHITDADFGNYSCIDQYTRTVNVTDRCTEMKYEGKGVLIRRQEYGRIQVDKLPVLEHVIYVPPGSLFGMFRSFNYHTLTHEDMPLSVEYTVNGKQLDVVCPSVSVFSCSFWGSLLFMFKYGIIVSGLPLLYINDTTVVNNVIMLSCACPDAYGWHQLSIFREICSDTRGRKVVQFDHPLRLLVLPAPHTSLHSFSNDSILYGKIADEIKDKYSERDIDTIILNLLKENAKWMLLKTDIIYSVTIIGLLLLTYCIYFIMRWLFVECCVFVSMHVICRYICTKNKAINCPNHENAIDNGELPIHYAAYISHCDDDYEWVTTKLLPHLEDICNIRVCLPDRDLRHGRNELNEMSEHMNASSKIIVVLSPDYLADYRCDQLQLHAMVLPSLYEKKRGPNEILLLKLKPCTPIIPLRWLPDVDTRNWSSLTNEREQLDNISNWVRGNNVRV